MSLHWVNSVKVLILFWTIDDLFMMTSSVWSFLESFGKLWRYHICEITWHLCDTFATLWYRTIWHSLPHSSQDFGLRQVQCLLLKSYSIVNLFHDTWPNSCDRCHLSPQNVLLNRTQLIRKNQKIDKNEIFVIFETDLLNHQEQIKSS